MTQVWGFKTVEDAKLASKLNLASVILSAILVVALPLSLMLMAKKSTTMIGGSASKGANTFGFILFLVAILHVVAIIALSSYVRFKLLQKIDVSA